MKNVNVNDCRWQPQLTHSQIKKSFGALNAQLTSIISSNFYASLLDTKSLDFKRKLKASLLAFCLDKFKVVCPKTTLKTCKLPFKRLIKVQTNYIVCKVIATFKPACFQTSGFYSPNSVPTLNSIINS